MVRAVRRQRNPKRPAQKNNTGRQSGCLSRTMIKNFNTRDSKINVLALWTSPRTTTRWSSMRCAVMEKETCENTRARRVMSQRTLQHTLQLSRCRRECCVRGCAQGIGNWSTEKNEHKLLSPYLAKGLSGSGLHCQSRPITRPPRPHHSSHGK